MLNKVLCQEGEIKFKVQAFRELYSADSIIAKMVDAVTNNKTKFYYKFLEERSQERHIRRIRRYRYKEEDK